MENKDNMKKTITQSRWLAAMLLLVAAMLVPAGAWAQTSTVTFTAKEGTAGNKNESFNKLIDGKYTSDNFSKWCMKFSSNNGAYIIFSASEPILVSGYSIVTGNDNASCTGRNPKSWKIYGCNDESAGRSSESWVLIDEVTSDTNLEDVNYQKYDFALSNPPSVWYRYFKMEISETKGASLLQISELILTYTTCNHQWVKTDDVVAPTCTEGGYDVYKCSVCQFTKKESNSVAALDHDWVSGAVVAPTCTEDGYTPQTCSRCHAEQKIDIVEATHHWGTDDICDVCGAGNSTPSKPLGDGSAANPYKIGTAGELYWFAALVNGTLTDGTGQNLYANAILTADITVNQGVLKADGSLADNTNGFTPWTPIGKTFGDYKGTFDGQGHIISGLYFNESNTDNVGLFGESEGTIKNVGVVDSYFCGNEYVGGVCAYSIPATITNCYFKGSVCGEYHVGGVCGLNDHGTITNCYNIGSVSGKWYVGGVCGHNMSGTTTNCYDTSSKTKTEFASGEVAYLLSQGCTAGTAGGHGGETFYDGSVWGQKIGTDNYPVLGSDYKVIKAAKGDKDANENDTYWATFSNQNSDVTLSVPSPRDLYVYNATVNKGRLILSERNDYQVAKGEGVLLKTDGEYVNAKANETNGLTASDNTNLMATPATEQTIEADAGHKLYRLTYNNVSTKTGLGFYLGVVGESKDGSQLKATPGKAYLKVATEAATDQSTSKLALGFAFPDNDDETVTGISGVTVSDRIQTSDRIYDLQGRPVVNPTKGVYIRNGRKVVY